MKKTDEEGRQKLDPERYAVLHQGATESAFSGELYYVHDDGVYRCGACGAELFR